MTEVKRLNLPPNCSKSALFCVWNKCGALVRSHTEDKGGASLLKQLCFLTGRYSSVEETWLQSPVLSAAKVSRAPTKPTADAPGASPWVTSRRPNAELAPPGCDSLTFYLLSRSPREKWSPSTSAFLTWRPTHSAATTIWMCTATTLLWGRSSAVSVEPSGPGISFPPPTPWCWRWWRMGRRRAQDLWPFSKQPNPMVRLHISHCKVMMKPVTLKSITFLWRKDPEAVINTN